MVNAEEFLKNYPPVRPPVKDLPPSKDQKGLVVDHAPPRKILFLGDERVGKTTFIRNYCEYMHDHYRCETYEGRFLVFTQFLFYRGQGGTGAPIRLLDVPARVTQESRRDQYPNFNNVVVLCFAIDDTHSLDHVRSVWLPECRRYLPASTKIYLLGLKNEMRLELEAAGRPYVTEARARRFHQEFEFSDEYLECSVEGNPAHARHCMDMLIAHAIVNDAPGPLALESP